MFRIVYSSKQVGIIFYCSFLLISACQNTDNQENNKNSLPYYNTPDFTPLFITDKSLIKQQITHQITGFSCTDQNNQVITQKNIIGKIHVANFFFTSCGSICPMMTKNLQQVSDAFNDDEDLVFLSFSVTPWVDSVPRLKEYAQHYQIQNPRWHFLTGKKNEIYTLARQSYFAEEDIGFSKDSTEFLHTEHFILIDKNLRIRGVYNGTLALEMKDLIADIQALKKEE